MISVKTNLSAFSRWLEPVEEAAVARSGHWGVLPGPTWQRNVCCYQISHHWQRVHFPDSVTIQYLFYISWTYKHKYSNIYFFQSIEYSKFFVTLISILKFLSLEQIKSAKKCCKFIFIHVIFSTIYFINNKYTISNSMNAIKAHLTWKVSFGGVRGGVITMGVDFGVGGIRWSLLAGFPSGGKLFPTSDKICLICMILCLKVGYDLLLSSCKCCFVTAILDDREARVEAPIFAVACGGIPSPKLMVPDKPAVPREELCAVELLSIRSIFVPSLVEWQVKCKGSTSIRPNRLPLAYSSWTFWDLSEGGLNRS